MKPPFAQRGYFANKFAVRVNGRIRAREVRVIGNDGGQLGVMPLNDALNMARTQGVDLVEVAPNATPPVCRLVDYGKYRYEQSKKDKESKKHHHANKVKEIQLSATIDSHDFGVKLGHAIDFLCEEMKIKLTLRFRGREMAHRQFGFQVVGRFIKDLTPYGQPDSEPKLVGRGLNVMLSPLPRNKRAKNPRQTAEPSPESASKSGASATAKSDNNKPNPVLETNATVSGSTATTFSNNPFSQLNVNLPD